MKLKISGDWGFHFVSPTVRASQAKCMIGTDNHIIKIYTIDETKHKYCLISLRRISLFKARHLGQSSTAEGLIYVYIYIDIIIYFHSSKVSKLILVNVNE